MKIRTLITAIVLAFTWITTALYVGAFVVVVIMRRAVPVDEMDRRRTAFRDALAAGRGHRVGSPERTLAVDRALRALFGVTPPHAEPIGSLIADEMRRHIRSTQQIDQIPDHLQRRAREAFDKIRRAQEGTT